MFCDMQKYLYSESVFSTLSIEIKHVKKISFGQNKLYKKDYFFFHKLQLIIALNELKH